MASFRYLLAKLINKLVGYKSNRIKLDELIKKGYLQIGDYTYQWQGLLIDIYEGSEAHVVIGKYCSISKNVRIITGGIHPTNWVSTYPLRKQFSFPGKHTDGIPYTKGDIVIGNDVWIGTGATILSGVKIGDGAVIATCAVVTKDIPDYAIAGGVPARVIKYRFSNEQINRLKKIQWWNWEKERIMKNIELLSSSNIKEFISKNIS